MISRGWGNGQDSIVDEISENSKWITKAIKVKNKYFPDWSLCFKYLTTETHYGDLKMLTEDGGEIWLLKADLK